MAITKKQIEELIVRANEMNEPKTAIRLEPIEYDAAIVGIVEFSGEAHLCYSKAKLLKIIEKIHGWKPDDCLEWYEYNTVRSLPYMARYGAMPVVLEN